MSLLEQIDVIMQAQWPQPEGLDSSEQVVVATKRRDVGMGLVLQSPVPIMGVAMTAETVMVSGTLKGRSGPDSVFNDRHHGAQAGHVAP